MRQIFLEDTSAGIADTDSYIAIMGTECDSNRAALRGVTNGIIQQVFVELGSDQAERLTVKDLC